MDAIFERYGRVPWHPHPQCRDMSCQFDHMFNRTGVECLCPRPAEVYFKLCQSAIVAADAISGLFNEELLQSNYLDLLYTCGNNMLDFTEYEIKLLLLLIITKGSHSWKHHAETEMSW